MNKAQLVDALSARIGDRRTAAAAVDGLVDVIVETVGAGQSVTLTGFGVFEPRRRAARVARNPRTGETVPVPETVVPSFRPGAAFREQIGRSEDAAAGATSAPRRAPRSESAAAAGASGASGAAAKPARKGGASAKGASAKGATKATPAAGAKGATAKGAAGKGAAANGAGKGTAASKGAAAKGSAKGTASKGASAKGTAKGR